MRALPPEDSLALEQRAKGGAGLVVAVPQIPRISNFDDLDPLTAEPGVEVRWIRPGTPIPAEADVVLLPGSKNTRAALDALRTEGWDIDIRAHHRRGGRVVGVCAGFQMLGNAVRDPDGIEGPAGETPGLGLLDIATAIGPEKRLFEIEATDAISGTRISGYEMHMGTTEGPGLARPWLTLDGRPEGAISPDGRVMGGYLHGLFSADGFRSHWIAAMGGAASSHRYEQAVEAALDAFADELEQDLDLDALLGLAR